jgi:phage recombination protein Bet
MANDIVKYEVGGQEIELSHDLIRKYLVNGESRFVTDQEIEMFQQLCRYQGLNPWLREAYLIKYSERNPATIVTGKETFLKRAQRNPRYKGHKVGLSDEGKVAWAEVYVDGYIVPIRCEVDYDEYVGRKVDGSITSMWKSKPHTMLKKVALVQALREAFPEDFGGLYSPEEINNIPTDMLPENKISPESISEVKQSKVEALKEKLGNAIAYAPEEIKEVAATDPVTTEPAKDEKTLKRELYKSLTSDGFTKQQIELALLPKSLADATFEQFKEAANRLIDEQVKKADEQNK